MGWASTFFLTFLLLEKKVILSYSLCQSQNYDDPSRFGCVKKLAFLGGRWISDVVRTIFAVICRCFLVCFKGYKRTALFVKSIDVLQNTFFPYFWFQVLSTFKFELILFKTNP